MAQIIPLWLLSLLVATVLGSFYARKYERADLFIGLYVLYVLASQVIATKIATFELGLITVTAPAAVLIFPFTFQLTDMVNEKFGRHETHRMILIAFITQVFMVLFFWFGTAMKPASFWGYQRFWEFVFGLIPRITIASWVAFLISENFDAWLYALIRRVTRGRHLWIRNVFSDTFSIGIDSIIFVLLAFYGVMPVIPLIIGQLITKWLAGVVDTPFMYLSRGIMRAKKE